MYFVRSAADGTLVRQADCGTLAHNFEFPRYETYNALLGHVRPHPQAKAIETPAQWACCPSDDWVQAKKQSKPSKYKLSPASINIKSIISYQVNIALWHQQPAAVQSTISVIRVKSSGS